MCKQRTKLHGRYAMVARSFFVAVELCDNQASMSMGKCWRLNDSISSRLDKNVGRQLQSQAASFVKVVMAGISTPPEPFIKF